MIDATTGILAVPVTAADPARPAQRKLGSQDESKPPVEEKAAQTVETALRSMETPLLGQHERLSISRDETTGTFIYRSIDRATGEVLRQWPVEAMLQFKAYLRHAEGVLIDSKV